MRGFLVVALVVGTSACKGAPEGDTGSSETVTVSIGATAQVASAEASLGAEAVRAHRTVNALLSAARLVVSEAVVRDRLASDHGGGRSNHCWTVPAVPQTEFDINYVNCGSIDTAGTVLVKDTPQGPVTFQFVNLTLSERQVVGTLALDGAGAEPSRWFVFDAQPQTPDRGHPSPVGVTIDGALTAVSWDGGASLTSDWQLWGVATLQTVDGSTTVRVGGEDPVALASATAPAEAPASGFDYLECRCPTRGDVVYDVSMGISEVHVDLDALKVEDDGVDDPVIELPVDRVVSGPATVSMVGCGQYATRLAATEGDLTFSIDGQTVANAIQAECDALVIDDPARCDAYRAAVSAVEMFELTLTTEQVDGLLDAAVADAFDRGWCIY